MRVLLDTHTVLWWLTDSPQLSARARRLITNGGTVAFVSAASLWEISIKESAGRLDTGEVDLPEEFAHANFLDLAISGRHAWEAGRLPRHHGDPFDRIIAAQALAEGLVCVTRDESIGRYGVPVYW
ncbi:MAG: PIN domain-containing protein [Acidobacteria bacterium]|nr:PIN domain-containing protein [Acidobacteriota bacterium]